jgi:hypothetical protein
MFNPDVKTGARFGVLEHKGKNTNVVTYCDSAEEARKAAEKSAEYEAVEFLDSKLMYRRV